MSSSMRFSPSEFRKFEAMRLNLPSWKIETKYTLMSLEILTILSVQLFVFFFCSQKNFMAHEICFFASLPKKRNFDGGTLKKSKLFFKYLFC